jgi:hypothetical protein
MPASRLKVTRPLLILGLLLAVSTPAVAVTTPTLFGSEIHRGNAPGFAGKATQANLSWVRYNGVLWTEVEPALGQRNWPAMTDADIKALAGNHVPLVIIRGTPGWAQRQDVAKDCGPIRNDPTVRDRFYWFVRDVVERYDGDGYNDVAGLPRGIKHWEFWNEPDAHFQVLGNGSPFGCWGDANDLYWGGSYYGEFLKTFHAAVKAADPSAQVVIGGLMMGCAQDPGGRCDLNQPSSINFFEGILRNGAGAYFDMVAYHSYAYYAYNTSNYEWDLNDRGWSGRGGVLLGKLNFLRDVMARYGVTGKPIIMNEGGLILPCDAPTCSPTSDHYNQQANHAVRLYTRAWANGLSGVVWYALEGPGWREAGLHDQNQNPRPAYNVLKLLATRLAGATYSGRVSPHPAVEGYKFTRSSGEFYIYWTNDGQVATIPTPANRMAVYNKFGQRVPTGPSINIGFDPIIIETHPTDYLAADFNGDGRGDVVRGYLGWSSMPTCHSTGGGWSCSEPGAVRYDGRPAIQSLVGDFNGDGRKDVAQVHYQWGSIPVCLATSSGGWSCTNSGASIYGGADTRYLTGDFNGDGKTDIAQANPAWGSIPVCFATGGGGWSCTNIGAAVHGGADTRYLTGDFNGDGLTDIAQVNPAWGSIPVCFATGGGGWSCTNIGAAVHGGADTRYLTGDFNGDGKTDIVQINLAWGSYPVCFATGGGGWSCTNIGATIYGSAYGFDGEGQFLTGDFNGDGKTDIAQTHRKWGTIPVCFATGGGGWSCTNSGAAVYNSNSAEQRFLATDVNGDLKTDIVQVYGGWLSMPLCLAIGNGSWSCGNPASE